MFDGLLLTASPNKHSSMQNSIYRLLIIIIIIFGFYCVDAYVQDLSYFRSATRNNLKIFYGTDITGEEEGGWRARVR